jgi:hypothetical protein
VELFSGCKQIKILINNLGLPKIQNWTCRNLDPLATGLLLVCWEIHKELQNFRVRPKNTGTFFWRTTASYDLETEVDQTAHIDSALILKL